ncbi:putative LRR receptor-like serine/threonine-protein kinase [Vitis vinifera]|uniref:Putative LRR receptor-like serine/threonine-protein kinase n=1 Tax=Vitis vinifera TaxID=29760 RepID=A0A438HH62_VITVI|nr:putative LRR receptor-like serine/threonine-protein kinase [Vitis vinifera]
MLSSFFFFFIIVVVDVSSSLFVWTVAALMAMKNKMNDDRMCLMGGILTLLIPVLGTWWVALLRVSSFLYNQFIGEIPSSLGLLTHLNYLRLSRNKLSGQIPGLVANLTGLSFLDLSFNNLSGPTPNILAKDYR